MTLHPSFDLLDAFVAAAGAPLAGGNNNATLNGTDGADQLTGSSGNDTLNGFGGDDILAGADGNDVLNGSTGNDQLFGGFGDDRIVWKAGDGSDLVDGGSGNDRLEISGSAGADNIAVVANGGSVFVGVGAAALDVARVETIVINTGDGNDVISAGNGLASLVHLTIDAGAGNDTISGGDGNDTLAGGTGNDAVTGGRGNDVVLLGSGDDSFTWNPGDGSDSVDGQDGSDTVFFQASNASEKVDLAAKGSHVSLTRDIGVVAMDLNKIERIDVRLLAGSDQLTVHDLAGTGVQQVNIDLTSSAGTGDGVADSLELQGSGAADKILLSASGSLLTVNGLSARVGISGAEGIDALTVAGGAGQDVIDASALLVGSPRLILDGGDGDDSLLGSQGADLLLGGGGKDSFSWKQGQGADVIEGQDGDDTLHVGGADAGDTIGIGTGQNGRLFVSDAVDQVFLDAGGIERLDIKGHAGVDNVFISSMAGGGVKSIDVDLGAADGQQDQIAVFGSDAAETLIVKTVKTDVSIDGLGAELRVHNFEGGGLDLLRVAGGAGDDTLDASAFTGKGLVLDAGAGADTLIGSAGGDTVTGGQGSDVARLGSGDDSFVWNPGDGSDTVDGDAGDDSLVFSGANIGETIDVSANGARAGLTRDIGLVRMDLNNVEHLDIVARGGADTINVHDLAGTDVQRVDIDLGAAGLDDGAVDVVNVEGTAASENITLSMHDGSLVVDGLAAQIVISNFGVGDQLHISGLGGDDVIDASRVLFSAAQLVLDGGDGADLLIGGDGADLMFGGPGDDVLIGGPGFDTLDGGPGDNVLIQ